MKNDYTRLAIGTKIGKEEIQTCPHCERPGLTKEINKMSFFTHSVWAGVNREGFPEIGNDECPKQPVPVLSV
jgi:hypothetical protein